MIVFSISALSAEIIPLKKPLQTKEEKEQKLLKDSLKPLPKPKAKIEVKPEAEVVETVNDIEEATLWVGSVAVSSGIQGLLVLIGCIASFVSLGKGSKSFVGAVLLSIAVFVSILAVITFPPSVLATLLHLFAAILSIIAPFTMTIEE